MNPEIAIYGLYVPSILLLALMALACSRALAWVFGRLGLYRLVWHPALFDVALFVILLGGLNSVFEVGFA